MTIVRIAQAFIDDVEEILDWSQIQFGDQARERYRILIATAVETLEAQPKIITAKEVPELGEGYSILHLASVARLVNPPCDRVKNPRHFILFRYDPTDDILFIARAVHDAADLSFFFLNEQYRSDS